LPSEAAAFYRTREPVPIRSGDILTIEKNPMGFRFAYAVMALLGWSAFIFFVIALTFGTV
jgi:hypothetical protein